MSALLASERTMNGIWLAPPVSVRVGRAMYTPEVAVAGTSHAADCDQFPQSISPVELWLRQLGWFVAVVAVAGIVAHLSGALPSVVAEPVDVDAVGRRRGVDLELHGATLVDADVGGEPLDAGVADSGDVPFGGGVSGFAVLGHDGVGRRVAWTRGAGGEGPDIVRGQGIASQVRDSRTAGSALESGGVGRGGAQQ